MQGTGKYVMSFFAHTEAARVCTIFWKSHHESEQTIKYF